ncbi:MAG TPA: RNA polymerase-binding protein DksA, partial [Caulobacteraceae bacterium]
MNAVAKVSVEEAYRPSDAEPFMNERQLEYFRQKLLIWKDDILRESRGTVVNLQAETENHPDLVDR